MISSILAGASASCTMRGANLSSVKVMVGQSSGVDRLMVLHWRETCDSTYGMPLVMS